jgi:hypothetical protein
MKLAPHNYATHMDVMLKRIRARLRADERERADLLREPQRVTPPMTSEARLANYVHQNRHWRLTPKQYRRLKQKGKRSDEQHFTPEAIAESQRVLAMITRSREIM